MAKPGFVYPNLVRVASDLNGSRGWSLCVGSGASIPVFPRWNELVRRVIAHQAGDGAAENLTQSLLKQFGPDAVIQAAQEQIGLSDEDFSELLVEELYANAQSSMSSNEWEVFIEGLSYVVPSLYPPKLVRSFLSLFQRLYPGTTAFEIARVIAESIDTGNRPQSILSFNAERLLFALCNLLIINRRLPSQRDPVIAGVFRRHIDLVTHSTSTRSANRIQYYMCHGALPVPGGRRVRAAESLDKLVFSESSYLQLANSSFSWQSSVFLECATTRPIVFVGMSMSDPNVRRWLGWSHTNRCQELATLGRSQGPSTLHYWIRAGIPSDEEKSWTESSVAHLGIRMVWLPSWDCIGEALRIMIGLPR